MDYLKDVLKFHEKFDLPQGGPPRLLADNDLRFRVDFMKEEISEYEEAHRCGDLAECLDALVDLCYVALGTAIFHGFDAPAGASGWTVFEAAWHAVQGANMAKVRGKNDGSDSKRRSPYDVVKPQDWKAPDHRGLLGHFAEVHGNDLAVPTHPIAGAPTVVCLCGSTRFKDAFFEANKRETIAGKIVLSVGFFHHREDDAINPELKVQLDVLHKQKIDLADEILVLNVGGYVGDSTASEIEHAVAVGKRVRWLEPKYVRGNGVEVLA